MPIGKVFERDMVTAIRDTSIFDAAKLMKLHEIGDVVVVDKEVGGIPIGIVTDRDLVTKVIADEADPYEVTVGDVMSEDLLILKRHQGIREALEMMCAKGVRRAPIVDDNNQLVGIITVDDLILLIADELGSVAKLVRKQVAE